MFHCYSSNTGNLADEILVVLDLHSDQGGSIGGMVGCGSVCEGTGSGAWYIISNAVLDRVDWGN